MSGICPIIMPGIVLIVDDDTRIAIITEGGPTIIIGARVPVDPSRPPMACGNPVPT